jgi:hypothetical protein
MVWLTAPVRRSQTLLASSSLLQCRCSLLGSRRRRPNRPLHLLEKPWIPHSPVLLLTNLAKEELGFSPPNLEPIDLFCRLTRETDSQKMSRLSLGLKSGIYWTKRRRQRLRPSVQVNLGNASYPCSNPRNRGTTEAASRPAPPTRTRVIIIAFRRSTPRTSSL